MLISFRVKQLIFLFLEVSMLWGQKIQEISPNQAIKSIVFRENGSPLQLPVVKLGASFQLHFDDLNADESNYYYRIKYFNYDWTPSILFQNEYMKGFDNLRIENYQTSFNTLQPYTHYQLDLPNEQTNFLIPGNYLLEVYNEADEMVFQRRFLLYEEKASVAAGVFRTRDLAFYQSHQSVQFSISPPKGEFFRDPQNQIHVTLLQNEQWETAIHGLNPQYNNGNRLEYRYDAQSRFEGGNEYLFLIPKTFKSPVPM